MKYIFFHIMSVFIILASSGSHAESKVDIEEKPALTGKEIVKQCTDHSPGSDNKSTFTVVLTDPQGNKKNYVYERYWKSYMSDDSKFADKTLLFAISPPEIKGSVFMRNSYKSSTGKKDDQWIFLPKTRSLKRVTIRDPGDRFLNSEVTYADITPRSLDADDHKFLKIKKLANGLEFYVVESKAKESRPLYSKRVGWYVKTENIKDCTLAIMDYYDRKDRLLKKQIIRWQRLGNSLVWETVGVSNIQEQRSSRFEVSNLKVNIGIKDSLFSERTLRSGIKAVTAQ